MIILIHNLGSITFFQSSHDENTQCKHRFMQRLRVGNQSLQIDQVVARMFMRM